MFIREILLKLAVPILILVGIILSYRDYKNAKNPDIGYEKALKTMAYWVIGLNLIGAFFVFNLFPEKLASSIGFTNCQFIRELSFYHLALGITVLVALDKKWNIDAVKAVVLIWCIFAILAGSYHIYEAVSLKNYSVNNLSGIGIGYISSAIFIFLLTKNNTVF
jgi:hypothetical protein